MPDAIYGDFRDRYVASELSPAVGKAVVDVYTFLHMYFESPGLLEWQQPVHTQQLTAT